MSSSDEDFSLVVMSPSQPAEDSLEGIKASIMKFKKQHEQLLRDQKELAASRDDLRGSAQQFRLRSEKLTLSLKEDKNSNKEVIAKEKAKLTSLKEQEAELMKQIQKVDDDLNEEKAEYDILKQQTDVFRAVPEKKVVFMGSTGNEGDALFEMKPRIVYPMEGGTALITFEEEVVAKKILDMPKHEVNLGGECKITVEAKPVHLIVPKLVEIESEVCPRRILISNLPKMDTEPLLMKLEIHFSKTKHGGGEVDDREFLPDSGTVVLTFLRKDIARELTEREYHEVTLQSGKKNHRVRVTPFLSGQITNLKTKMSVCPRTVLLTGIPTIMERETLQDLLEIHFQKNCNGGGEITAFLYNPLGENTTALFKGVSENKGGQEEA
uniref:interferon-induced 35 kDa protein n=1 Tax=Semicossyphus pulcher TaxID=241346 RepID=UPI0037E7520E